MDTQQDPAYVGRFKQLIVDTSDPAIAALFDWVVAMAQERNAVHFAADTPCYFPNRAGTPVVLGVLTGAIAASDAARVRWGDPDAAAHVVDAWGDV
jgi:hypothetical protein